MGEREMSSSEADQILDDVTTLLKGATPNDLALLDRVRGRFEALAGLPGAGSSYLSAVERAIALLDRIILRDLPFAEGLTALQSELPALRAQAIAQAVAQSAGPAMRVHANAASSATPGAAAGATAGAPHSPLPAAVGGKYLTFALGAEEYGVDVLAVREIIGMLDITPVPRAPECVRGVVNLRGQVIPVIDLRLCLGMPAIAYSAETCIVVAEVEGEPIGLIVDHVSEVADIRAADVVPTPNLGVQADTTCVRGLGKVHGRVKILLDVERILVAGGLFRSGERAA
jgi:purine-binding chemotaxis protein CheW